MQAQRFFIEHAFKEARAVLGPNQFQTRERLARHHQVALNMLLPFFMFKEKPYDFEVNPLLSAWDIRQVLNVSFSSTAETLERIIQQIFERHKIRQKDIIDIVQVLECAKVELS